MLKSNHCTQAITMIVAVVSTIRSQGASMNRETFKAICAKAIVAAVTTSGLLALGAQTASAQAITATVPFAFSAGDQPFPSGTYQFTLRIFVVSLHSECKGRRREAFCRTSSTKWIAHSPRPPRLSQLRRAKKSRSSLSVPIRRRCGVAFLCASFSQESVACTKRNPSMTVTYVPQKVWSTHCSGRAGVV